MRSVVYGNPDGTYIIRDTIESYESIFRGVITDGCEHASEQRFIECGDITVCEIIHEISDATFVLKTIKDVVDDDKDDSVLYINESLKEFKDRAMEIDLPELYKKELINFLMNVS